MTFRLRFHAPAANSCQRHWLSPWQRTPLAFSRQGRLQRTTLICNVGVMLRRKITQVKMSQITRSIAGVEGSGTLRSCLFCSDRKREVTWSVSKPASTYGAKGV